MLTLDQLAQARTAIQPLILDCGSGIVEHNGTTPFTEKTGAYDLLTEFDLKIENQLKEGLAKLYPNIPFVGEETKGDYSAEEFWLVDPIDGTIHFTRGLPFSTIMVSLVQQNKPVLGAIYNFISGEYFSASLGGGAYCNETPIRVSNRSLKDSVVLAEINLDRNNNASLLRQISSKYKIINTCSAGFEFYLVANGAVEARVTKDPYGKAYDFAAGTILIQEAGGVVRELSGADYTLESSDFVAAASEQIYEALTNILASNPQEERL